MTKKAPKMPTESASDSPEVNQVWLEYWSYWNNRSNYNNNYADRREYHKRYRDNVTKQRQINKMRELMRKYPQEALECAETLDIK